ncbi:hypothetical protein B0I35DRAFT_405887 [Stachybotrys elegans]|uniref:Uncharacterized protein n=1 Tax=Stachybotrys elegans TaxID=80388 RepID=A0A8K0SZQ3_9HYPO|nr:hypothetical protein B0I35DRAFT_405887 [Stachybotrys elegans]
MVHILSYPWRGPHDWVTNDPGPPEYHPQRSAMARPPSTLPLGLTTFRRHNPSFPQGWQGKVGQGWTSPCTTSTPTSSSAVRVQGLPGSPTPGLCSCLGIQTTTGLALSLYGQVDKCGITPWTIFQLSTARHMADNEGQGIGSLDLPHGSASEGTELQGHHGST